MSDEFSKEQLLEALRALRKRLRMYRQDDESRLGGKGLTSGRSSGIVGIKPPQGFPAGIWQRLVEQGKLKEEGAGTYSIVE